jgi:hypothetical protein
MKQSPPKDRPDAAGAARRDPPRKAREFQYDLKVRYYCSMKPQRIYPLTVEVPRSARDKLLDSPTGVTVVVRPLIPGALVTPAEQALDVSRPGAAVMFHVTPVARGRLAGARVEVLCDGRPAQELRLRMKSGTQCLTWVLLLLTLAVPPLILHYTRYAPLKGHVPDRRRLLDSEKKEGGQPDKPGDPGANPVPPVNPGGNVPPAAARGAVFFQPGPGGGGMQRGAVPPPVPPARLGADADGTVEYMRPGFPEEVLRHRIETYLSLNAPDFPGKDRVVKGISWLPGVVYGFLCDHATEERAAFWIGVGLLVLTLGSWMAKRTQRTSLSRSVVIPLGAGGPPLRAAQSAETLPLSPLQTDAPPTVEPAD